MCTGQSRLYNNKKSYDIEFQTPSPQKTPDWSRPILPQCGTLLFVNPLTVIQDGFVLVGSRSQQLRVDLGKKSNWNSSACNRFLRIAASTYKFMCPLTLCNTSKIQNWHTDETGVKNNVRLRLDRTTKRVMLGYDLRPDNQDGGRTQRQACLHGESCSCQRCSEWNILQLLLLGVWNLPGRGQEVDLIHGEASTFLIRSHCIYFGMHFK